MKNTKLREWILNLTKKEWLEISNITSSGIIYISPVSNKALSHIIKFHKKFDNMARSEERTDILDKNNYNSITKSNISDKDWGNIKSELSRACSIYKKINLALSDNISIDIDLQTFYLDNKMLKNFDSIQTSISKKLNDTKIDDCHRGYYLSKNIETQLYDVRSKQNRKKLIDLNDYQYSIDLFYYENKLRILCEKLIRNFYQKTYLFTEDEKKYDELIPKHFLDFPQINIYSKLFHALVHESEDTFQVLKKLLLEKKYIDKLSEKYLGEIYSILISYSIKKINDGNKEHIHYYLEFIQKLADFDALTEQGEIPNWRFKNIIKVALKVNNYEWADSFIKTQQNKLDKDDKIPILEYINALMYFTKGEYDSAFLELNNKAHSKDPYIKIDAIFLFLYILLYLKGKEEVDFDRYKENLRSVINTKANEISKIVLTKWRKGIKWIGKAYNIEKEEKDNLRIQVEEDEFFPGKQWLIEYLNK